MSHETSNDLIDNPSPRCPCICVLDTSGSMGGGLFSSGPAPIDQLNEGFQRFLDTLKEDEVAAYSVEVSVITAGGSVQEVLPFTTAMQIERDKVKPFQASGQTPLGSAVELALKKLDARKAEYKNNGVPYYQPWLVIISDGVPTDNWQQAAQEAKSQSANRKLVSLVIGVKDADMYKLGQFSSRPALKLDGLKFSEFFEWLSASMSRVSASSSTSASVTLPSTDSWASI